MNKNHLLKKIDRFESEQLDDLKSFKSAGGKVAATFCRFFPISLLSGVGLRPIRILTGATTRSESAGERLIRADACSYCKSILGNFMEKQDVHAMVDLVVGVITCDQMRRTLERLSVDLNIPVFPVQLPATATPAAEDFFVDCVRRVIKNISEYTGNPLDLEIVRAQDQYRKQAARVLSRLLWAGKLSPAIVHKLNRQFFTTQPSRLLRFLSELNGKWQTINPEMKIIVTGNLTCDGEDPIFEIFDQKNVGIIPLSCTGIHALERFEEKDMALDDDLVGNLARSVFRSAPCIRRRPNQIVYEKIAEAITKTSASGIILKTLPFCDLWYTEKERMKRSFDVPVLVLDSGYGEGTQDRMIGRIEAFLETLSC